MAAQYLWQIGSVIIAVMAGLHLQMTFFSNKFSSRNEKMVADMKTSHPNLTNKMTMWNAWIGFNATHSMGGIFIGVINFYLAARYFEVLQADHFFFIFNIITISFFVWLAKTYWFRTILIGVSLVWLCYVAAYILTLVR
ncbi:hypothetical protein BH09BAC1_BH09BAC1_18820 [soil metagenome]